MKNEIDKWIEECPQKVIGRVITDPLDLINLGITKCLYEDTLVVVDIKTIADFYRGIYVD